MDIAWNFYRKKPIFACGFAICRKDASGNIFFKTAQTEYSQATKENALVKFTHIDSTGFIASVKEINIKQERRKFALVLTAGHAAYNLKAFKPHHENYMCELENQGFGIAYLLKCFIFESPHELKSRFTSTNYHTPGDFAILLLEVLRGEIDNYEIATEIQIGADCIITGYPTQSDNFRNTLPQLENLSDQEVYNESKKIFCGFTRKVYAKGRVESENNGLIEISCSAAYGMSGSPIISGRKFIGIYTGGPPVPGQRDCMKILQQLDRNENPAKILRKLNGLTKYDMHYTIPLFSRLLNSSIFRDFESIGKALAGEKLTQNEEKKIRGLNDLQLNLSYITEEISKLILENIRDAVVYFKNKDLLKANVGISINHEFFELKIKRIINEFLNCTEFISVNELVEYLKE